MPSTCPSATMAFQRKFPFRRSLLLLMYIGMVIRACATPSSMCVDCPDYVALSAADKEAVCMAKIKSTSHGSAFPNDWVGIIEANEELAKTAWNETISESFDRYSDEYPAEHVKVIHTHGSVASIRLVADEGGIEATGLTGLFRGAQHGLLRASLVKDPEAPCKGVPFTSGCFSPGIAAKFFRDGTYSSNLIAMYVLGDGQGTDYNFFAHPQKTWVPKPEGIAAEAVMKVFSYAAEEPFHLDVRDFAGGGNASMMVDPNDAVVAPSNVYFVPPESMRSRFSVEKHEFRQDLASIEPGTHIYDIVVPRRGEYCLCGAGPCPEPTAGECEHVRVGMVETTSRFYSSDWGDQKLFFQHERFIYKPRSMCRDARGVQHPSTDVYRMSHDLSIECAPGKDCPDGSTKLASACPFAGRMPELKGNDGNDEQAAPPGRFAMLMPDSHPPFTRPQTDAPAVLKPSLV